MGAYGNAALIGYTYLGVEAPYAFCLIPARTSLNMLPLECPDLPFKPVKAITFLGFNPDFTRELGALTRPLTGFEGASLQCKQEGRICKGKGGREADGEGRKGKGRGMIVPSLSCYVCGAYAFD